MVSGSMFPVDFDAQLVLGRKPLRKVEFEVWRKFRKV
jgi:hypothetical protein